jgi:hypothetical protein
MSRNQGSESKNVVRPNVRTGTGSRSARPAGVAQLGQSQGDHITNKSDTGYRGERLHNDRTFQKAKFGNELALNVGKGGCGTGRTVHERGSQATHGATNPGSPRPAGREILGAFGPESKGRG